MEKLPQNLKSLLKENVSSLIQNSTSDNAANSINLHLFDQIIDAGTKLIVGQEQHVVNRKSALIFADHAPLLNWGHDCEYLLFDTENGRLLEKVPSQFPPLDFEFNRYLFEDIFTPVRFEPSQTITDVIAGALKGTFLPFIQGERYAILFSGMSNNRHVNDMEFLYRTLIDTYGFKAANIFVLNHDGTLNYNGGPTPIVAWPGDGTAYRMKVDGKGIQADFEKILEKVGKKLSEKDFLLIHTNNHGGHDGTQSNLCTYPSWAAYTASDFAAKIKKLPKFDTLMVMMEQCHSGGFINPILTNSPAKSTHVAAACVELNNSAGGADFDPYALDWIAGVTGHYGDNSNLKQNIDTTADGRISASEAHNYAKAVKVAFDTPVSGDSPVNCGDKMFLGRTASLKASVNWGNGKIYFFKNDRYYRYDWANDKVDPNYPKLIAGNWNGLWPNGIDAAVNYGNGKAYFFKGSEYVRYDIAADKVDAGYPKPIAGNWNGLWTSNIEAAVSWGNGKVYFFKGTEYIRWDIAADKVDAGYPKPIAGNWGSLWANGIESALLADNKKAYFFKGGQYTRYDVASNAIDSGYPVSTIDNWHGLV